MDGQVQTLLKPPRDGHQLGWETKFHHPFLDTQMSRMTVDFGRI
jgi:hypothetical protein